MGIASQKVWEEWRTDNLIKLATLSKERPRDMRLQQRIKDLKIASGEEVQRLGEIIRREYSQIF